MEIRCRCSDTLTVTQIAVTGGSILQLLEVVLIMSIGTSVTGTYGTLTLELMELILMLQIKCS